MPIIAQDFTNDSIQAMEYHSKGISFYPHQLDSAIYYTNKGIPLFKKAKVWDGYVQSFSSLSSIYYAKEDFNQFKHYAFLNLEMANKHLDKQDPNFGNAWNNLSFYYREIGDNQKRINCLKKGLDFYQKESANNLIIAKSYRNIGTVYRSIADYDQAINYLTKALEILTDSLGNENFSVAFTNVLLGHTYRNNKKLKKASIHYHRFLSIIENPSIKKSKTVYRNAIFCHRGLAETHLFSGQLDSADFHINQAIKLFPKVSPQHQLLPLTTIGNLNLEKKDYTKALEAFVKAKEISFDVYKSLEKNTVKSRSIKNIGRVYLLKKEYDLALTTFQEALVLLSLDFDSLNLTSNPTLKQLLSKREGVEIIHLKAKAFYQKWLTHHQENDLILAFQNYNFASKLIDFSRRNIAENGSKLFLAENAQIIYQEGIKIAIELYQKTEKEAYLEAAFIFTEQSKATLLSESLQNKKALTQGQIPTTQIEDEETLRKEISFYESKIIREKQNGKTTDLEKIKKWNSNLFNLKKEHQDIIQNFEKEYPKYYDLKISDKKIAIKDIQNKMLTTNNALIEYLVGEDYIAVFCITKDQAKVYQLPKTKNYSILIEKIKGYISQPPFGQNSLDNEKEFIQNSHELYVQILAPILKTLDSKITNLVVIPHDILSYIPFGVLLTTSEKNLDYLIKDYAISYNYSSSLWYRFSENKSKSHANSFIGFAPSFPETIASTSRGCTMDQVYSLKCNTREVSEIQELINGKAILDQHATKNVFEKEVGNTQIIHLATHACSDEQSGLNKIYFTDNFILDVDLSQLNINADLAVLSACNTGSGKLVKGEGVWSLSRGFILAGCVSTLTSLWQVDDCTTSNIMINFYKNLMEGSTKDQAIRNAKINHLEKADQVMSHPYYWAAFVQSGNVATITFSANNILKWSLLLIAALIGMGILKRIQTA